MDLLLRLQILTRSNSTRRYILIQTLFSSSATTLLLVTFATIFDYLSQDLFIRQTKVSLLQMGLGHAFKKEQSGSASSTTMAQNTHSFWITVCIIQTCQSISSLRDALLRSLSIKVGIPTKRWESSLNIQLMSSFGHLVDFGKHFWHQSPAFLKFYLMKDFKNKSFCTRIISSYANSLSSSNDNTIDANVIPFDNNEVHDYSDESNDDINMLFMLNGSFIFKDGKGVNLPSDISWATHLGYSFEAQDLDSKWYWILCQCHPSFTTQCTWYQHHSGYRWTICGRTSAVNMPTTGADL